MPKMTAVINVEFELKQGQSGGQSEECACWWDRRAEVGDRAKYYGSRSDGRTRGFLYEQSEKKSALKICPNSSCLFERTGLLVGSFLLAAEHQCDAALSPREARPFRNPTTRPR
jgi:hypothetical protein